MEIILRLLFRRLMALPVMILGVTALVFVVLQFTPGDPATVALGESASEAAKELYREMIHFSYNISAFSAIYSSLILG